MFNSIFEVVFFNFKEYDGPKDRKVKIKKLCDVKKAGGKYFHKCTYSAQ